MRSTVPLLLLLLVTIGHLSLIFPQGCSHFSKYQSSSVWCAASMSPGRVARLDLHVMKVWWGKTSGYSAGEQQCTPGYQRAVPNRENREKRHRKKPTRPTVTHAQWLLHSSFGKKHFSAVLPCFCLKIRCAFLFLSYSQLIYWLQQSQRPSRLYIYIKWTLYVSGERSSPVSRAIFSRTGSYLHC